MALKLNFSKVSILSFNRTPASGTVLISCAPTKTIAKAMGWDDLPDWQKSALPVGELQASLVEFTPSHSDLSKHAFDLMASAVYSFKLIRKEIKKGKGAKTSKAYRLELHCSVDFTDDTGGRKIEQYMHTVQESTMRVTYEPEPEQQDLPGVDPTSDGQIELEGMVKEIKKSREVN